MSAFLNGDLNGRNFMEQPLSSSSVKVPDWLCFSLQSLYGLKQSARQWNQKFDKFLIKFGPIPSEADPFVYHNLTGPPVFLDIFVGDGAN